MKGGCGRAKRGLWKGEGQGIVVLRDVKRGGKEGRDFANEGGNRLGTVIGKHGTLPGGSLFRRVTNNEGFQHYLSFKTPLGLIDWILHPP